MPDLMTLPPHVLARPPQRGHAAPPGTGPKGETCGTCRHLHESAWDVCSLKARYKHFDRRSEIKLDDPACARWEGRDG